MNWSWMVGVGGEYRSEYLARTFNCYVQICVLNGRRPFQKLHQIYSGYYSLKKWLCWNCWRILQNDRYIFNFLEPSNSSCILSTQIGKSKCPLGIFRGPWLLKLGKSLLVLSKQLLPAQISLMSPYEFGSEYEKAISQCFKLLAAGNSKSRRHRRTKVFHYCRSLLISPPEYINYHSQISQIYILLRESLFQQIFKSHRRVDTPPLSLNTVVISIATEHPQDSDYYSTRHLACKGRISYKYACPYDKDVVIFCGFHFYLLQDISKRKRQSITSH